MVKCLSNKHKALDPVLISDKKKKPETFHSKKYKYESN